MFSLIGINLCGLFLKGNHLSDFFKNFYLFWIDKKACDLNIILNNYSKIIYYFYFKKIILNLIMSQSNQDIQLSVNSDNEQEESLIYKNRTSKIYQYFKLDSLTYHWNCNYYKLIYFYLYLS